MSLMKLFDPFARRPGTTTAQFSDHWTNHHAEIAKGLPQIARYVQSHRRAEAGPLVPGLGPTWCDGSSETWYDGLASFEEMVADPEVGGLLVDEPNFLDLDLPRSPVACAEHGLDDCGFDPADRGVKVLVFARGLRGRFAKVLGTDERVRLGRELGVSRHVLCPRIASSDEYGNPLGDHGAGVGDPWDGVIELWWPSEEARRSAAASDPIGFARLVTPEAIDPARSMGWLADERVIIA